MTPTERALQYAKDIVSGKQPASKLVKLACERHLRDLEEGKFHYHTKRADGCVNWMEKYCRYRGEKVDLLPWQNWLVTQWAGWEKEDGTRRFEEVLAITGKSSLKTTVMAKAALFELAGDKYNQDTSPQIVTTANTSDQASICFNMAVDMVRDHPKLSEKIDVYGGYNKPTSLFRKKGAFIDKGSIVKWAGDTSGGDFKGKGGANLTFLAVDEPGEISQASGILAALRKARKMAREFTIWLSSNPSSTKDDAELSPYYKRSVDMLYELKRDDTLLAFIAELDDDAPHSIPELLKEENHHYWYQANPGLDQGAPPKAYIFKELQASLVSPSEQLYCLRLHMGVFADEKQASSIISQNIFDTLVVKKLSKDRHKHPCFIGIDLSNIYQAEGANDLTSIATVWKLPGDRVEMEINSYIPNKNIQKRQSLDGRPWPEWSQDGTVHIVPDAWVQYDFIAEQIKKILDDNTEVVAMSYDTYNFKYLRDALKQQGITGSKIEFLNHLQTAKPGVAGGKEKGDTLFMPQSIKHFLQLVSQERLKILINPLNKIAFTTTETKPDNYGNTTIYKGPKRRDKNDPAVAGIMAIGAAMEHKNDNFMANYIAGLSSGLIPTEI